MENKELGIYIHIPFCKQKCYYCDFVSFSNKQNFVENYVEAVKKEINNYFQDKTILERYTVTTIYIGGGTPSSLSLELLTKLFNILKMIKTSKSLEFSFEND